MYFVNLLYIFNFQVRIFNEKINRKIIKYLFIKLLLLVMFKIETFK